MASRAVKILANLMRVRKENAEPPYVLILGAGASLTSGASSFGKVIESVVRNYSVKDPSVMSEDDKLAEFYDILDGFSESERYAIIKRHIEGQRPSAGYHALAQLAREGYFDVIFSTNYDTFVEDAFADAGLRSRDFTVLINGQDSEEEIIKALGYRQPRIKLVKLHGDLSARIFAFTPDEIFQFSEKVERVLTGYLSRDVIINGHGMRDDDINRCLRERGGSLWYVSPSAPKASDFIWRAMRVRRGATIDGEDGYFDNFFCSLRDELVGPAEAAAPTAAPSVKPAPRPTKEVVGEPPEQKAADEGVSIWQRLEATDDSSMWKELEAAVDTGVSPEADVLPEEPLEEEKRTGRTLWALKIRRPARLWRWLWLTLGLLVVLGLLAVIFWAYTRLSSQLAPVPWPTPRVEATQTPMLGFGNLWNGDPGVQSRLGMGVSEERSILYLEQRFSDNGIMLQLTDPPSPFIYVLYDNGQWEVYEGQPAVESQATPTGGLALAPSFQPIYEGRKSVRERLGPPQSHPQKVRGAIQDFEHGHMIWTGADDLYIYTLFVVDGQPDRWTLYPDQWLAPGDVVFTSDWTGHWQVHTATSEGSEEVQLTVEPVDVDNFEPVWVPPERKSVAFVSTASGLPKIWLIDRNGSNRRQLTTGPGTDGHPSMVWYGELVAFHSDRDGVFQIYLIDLDGTNVRRLTNGSFDNRNPDWAPDGRSLVFDSEREGKRGIYSVEVETGKIELLLDPEEGGTYQQPAWSPDGAQLAFVSRAAGRHVICVANADGSELTKLEGTAGFEKVDAPVWSPDGQRLAFTAHEGGKSSIAIVNVSDGSVVTRISGYGDYKDPDW